MKTEAQFQTKFGRWVKHRWEGGTSAFELKLSKKESIPFSNVAEHQIAALLASKHGSMHHKISDAGLDRKPFDSFVMKGSEAYVVIMYYLERGDNEFIMIDVDDFVVEEKTSLRKSLTRQRAREIGKCFSL